MIKVAAGWFTFLASATVSLQLSQEPRYVIRNNNLNSNSTTLKGPSAAKIASKFGNGVFETGPYNLAGPGFETGANGP
jgi:hypothetical protein